MPTEPRGPLPRSELSEVPLSELAVRTKRVATNEALMEERGQAILEWRLRDFSWRQIEEQTGVPHANARRWLKKYLDAQE